MDTQLSRDQALDLAIKTLVASGATEENATPLANGIIQAEIDGIKSHGFHYLPIYCLHLSCKKVRGNASPKINHKSNVALSVDADNRGLLVSCSYFVLIYSAFIQYTQEVVFRVRN